MITQYSGTVQAQRIKIKYYYLPSSIIIIIHPEVSDNIVQALESDKSARVGADCGGKNTVSARDATLHTGP